MHEGLLPVKGLKNYVKTVKLIEVSTLYTNLLDIENPG